MGIFIKLLGGPAFSWADGSALHLPTRKSEALFAYLLERGGEAVSREALAAHLWPLSGEERARASLRQEISVLRKALGPDFTNTIITEADRVAVSQSGLDVDIWHIRSHRRLGHDPVALIALLDRYTAPFLDAFRIRSQPFSDWVWVTRQSLEDEILALGQTAMSRCTKDNDHDHATKIALHLCRIDPSYESAHQTLIKTHIRTGDMSSAQRQLRQCEAALSDHLDAKVSPETLALFEVLDDVPPASVAAEIERLPRQRRFVTVLSVMTNLDIADPEDFDRTAEATSALIQNHIKAKGGTILRAFDGDVLGCFGYPVGHDKDPDTATFVALDILDTLNAEIDGTTPVGPSKTQIGLAYGQVLISTDKAGQPRISGAVLSAAKALARKGAFGAVSICGEMAKAVSSTFSLIPVEAGDEPQQIVRQNGPITSQQPEMLLDHKHPMVGRKDQLDHLLGLLKQAKRGSGGVAAILGNPGEGKSRLVYEATQKAFKLGFDVQAFYGRLGAQQSAFGPVLDQMLHKGAFRTNQPTVLELENWLAGHSTDLPYAAPYFSALIKSLNPQHPEKIQVSEEEKQAALNVFAACHASGPQKRPVFMVFEDIQWFDPTTCEAIVRLIDVVPEAPVFVLLVSRLGEAPDIVEHPFVQKVLLSPLQPENAEALLRGFLGETPTSTSTIKSVLDRAEGNPLTLEEFAKAITFQQDEDTYKDMAAADTLTHDQIATPIETPARLLPLLLSRIDAIPGAIQTLQYACVFGRKFSDADLAQILKPARANRKVIAELIAAEILYGAHGTSDTSYIFKHALIGEAIYSTIPRSERAALHTAAAECLLEGANRTNVSEVARHFKLASKYAQAAHYFELSGDRATGLSAHSESVSEYREALEMVGQLPSDTVRLRAKLTLNSKIATQLIALRGIPTKEVIPYYTQALALSETLEDADELVKAIWVGWSIHLMVADLDQCIDVVTKLSPTIEKLGTPVPYIIEQYMLGVTQAYRGELHNAAAHLEAVRKSYNPNMKDELQSRFSMDIALATNSFLGWIYALLGQRDEAEAATQRSLKMAQQNDNGLSVVFANVFAATKCLFLENADAARQHAKRAQAGADEMGFVQWSAQARMQLARIADISGDPDALKMLQQAREDYLSTGMVLARPYVDVWIAEAQTRQGKNQDAIDTLDALKNYTDQSGQKYYDFACIKARDNALSNLTENLVSN